MHRRPASPSADRGDGRLRLPARWRRSRSAGCSSDGRAARPSRAPPAGARRRCAAPPSGRRPRVAGLERPLGRYLLELEPELAEGRSWYGEPGAAELLEWGAGARARGRRVAPLRVAQAYLELAVLVRALEGLTTAARMGTHRTARRSGPGSSTSARTCSGGALEDLRALAA